MLRSALECAICSGSCSGKGCGCGLAALRLLFNLSRAKTYILLCDWHNLYNAISLKPCFEYYSVQWQYIHLTDLRELEFCLIPITSYKLPCFSIFRLTCCRPPLPNRHWTLIYGYYGIQYFWATRHRHDNGRWARGQRGIINLHCCGGQSSKVAQTTAENFQCCFHSIFFQPKLCTQQINFRARLKMWSKYLVI